MKILVVHGPNLGILEKRKGYGDISLEKLNNMIKDTAKKLKYKVDIYQSNHEGEIVDILNKAIGRYNLLIINPAAFTHYSFAIRDAISALGFPAIEVHLTNIFAREDFRKKSVITEVCSGIVCGMGYKSYLLSIECAEDIKN